MKWILGIVAVMLLVHLWTRWEAHKMRRKREEAAPETPPRSGDPAPPR